MWDDSGSYTIVLMCSMTCCFSFGAGLNEVFTSSPSPSAPDFHTLVSRVKPDLDLRRFTRRYLATEAHRCDVM